MQVLECPPGPDHPRAGVRDLVFARVRGTHPLGILQSLARRCKRRLTWPPGSKRRRATALAVGLFFFIVASDHAIQPCLARRSCLRRSRFCPSGTK